MVYPATVPVDAINVLFQSILNSDTADTKKMVAAAYQVAGYVLGQTIGEPTQMIGMVTPNLDDLKGKIDDRWLLILQHLMALVAALIAKENK